MVLPNKLTEDIIRRDNPHFGPVIRVVEEVEPYTSEGFDFSFKITVGAHHSKFMDEPNTLIDAWATYLWSPSCDEWVLGAN